MGEHMINSDLQDGDQVTKHDTPADGAPTDPNYYEERFRVDRRKLEQMLQGECVETESVKFLNGASGAKVVGGRGQSECQYLELTDRQRAVQSPQTQYI